MIIPSIKHFEEGYICLIFIKGFFGFAIERRSHIYFVISIRNYRLHLGWDMAEGDLYKFIFPKYKEIELKVL